MMGGWSGKSNAYVCMVCAIITFTIWTQKVNLNSLDQFGPFRPIWTLLTHLSCLAVLDGTDDGYGSSDGKYAHSLLAGPNSTQAMLLYSRLRPKWYCSLQLACQLVLSSRTFAPQADDGGLRRPRWSSSRGNRPSFLANFLDFLCQSIRINKNFKWSKHQRRVFKSCTINHLGEILHRFVRRFTLNGIEDTSIDCYAR